VDNLAPLQYLIDLWAGNADGIFSFIGHFRGPHFFSDYDKKCVDSMGQNTHCLFTANAHQPRGNLRD